MWWAFDQTAVVTLATCLCEKAPMCLLAVGQACWGLSHVLEQTEAAGSVPAQEQTRYKHVKYVLAKNDPYYLWRLSLWTLSSKKPKSGQTGAVTDRYSKCFLLKDEMLAQAVLGRVILIQPLRPSIWICGLNEVVLWVAKCLFMAAICARRWMGSFWQKALSLFLDVKSQLGIMEQALFGISPHYLVRRAHEILSGFRRVEQHLSEADFKMPTYLLFCFCSSQNNIWSDM